MVTYRLVLLSCAYVAYPVILDLRSGSRKSSSVPPPRPYKKRAMVVHSPDKFEVQRAAAAAASAASLAPASTPTPSDVPPSVLATASSAATRAGLSASTPATGDLLGTAHGFDAWHGTAPPDAQVLSLIHI